MKNVLILSGSPRKGGNSDLLCDEFAKGAKEAGHEVTKINICDKKISPCCACYFCREHVQFDKKLDYRSNMPQFMPEAYEQNRELLNLLHSMAAEKNATPAQISMAWMLCKKPYVVPIPGTRKEERLKENAASADIKLTSEEVMSLDNALDNMEMSAVFGGSKIVK